MDKMEIYKDYFQIKPYSTLEKGFAKIKGSVTIKNPTNFTNFFYLIIDTYLIIKVLKTIHEQNLQISDKYCINYKNNSTLDDSTFEIVADQRNFTIDIITGQKLNSLKDGANVENHIVTIALDVFSQFLPLLDRAIEEFPKMEIYNLSSFLKGIAQDA